MKKIINFILASNRYKHLIGGFLIGLFAFSNYNALYATSIAAYCLELKDKAKGGKWDWIDILFTLFGGFLGRLIMFLIYK